MFGGCHLDTGQDVRVCECFDTVRGTWEDEFHIRKGKYVKDHLKKCKNIYLNVQIDFKHV